MDNSASDLQTLANALEWSALYFNPGRQRHTSLINEQDPYDLTLLIIPYA